jgi:hypothetical protein
LAFEIAPECSIKLYDNFESFNAWTEKYGGGKTAKQLLDDAIRKLNAKPNSHVEIV